MSRRAALLLARAEKFSEVAEIDRELATLDDAPVEFDQDRRPAWAPTKNVYLCAWRELRHEHHTGVHAVGQLRLMSRATADAWIARKDPTWRPRPKKTAAPLPIVKTAEEQLLAELGGRRVAS